jgi:hypothetical protein
LIHGLISIGKQDKDARLRIIKQITTGADQNSQSTVLAQGYKILQIIVTNMLDL